jgi:transaldolase / glucose-6-phosphate isomerase
MPRTHGRRPPSSGAGADPSGEGWSLGPAEEAVTSRLAAWSSEDAVGRIWRKDPRFWPQAPAPEVPDRLGWLRAPEQSAARVAELRAFAQETVGDGVEHVVVLGMGGSSLAPQVIGKTLRRPRGGPDLTILDSTHPDAVRKCAVRASVERSVYVVSSKSGTTLEPNAFFRFFWERAAKLGGNAGRRFVAITDPGTPLEKLAAERRFRAFFAAP